MPLNKKMLAALNDQITMELSASHSYLAMAGWFESQNLPGMAAWMQMQSAEEREHGLKFFEFVVDRGEEVSLGALAAPQAVFGSALEVFETSLAQEKAVTASINNLYTLANAEGEYEAIPLLTWFISEQVEEEASVDQVVEDLRRAGTDQQLLLMLDRELGARKGEEE
ncbi:MAG: ferritin [Acidimicrobiia bacterium]|nr:ferritin [Acidimicrobiia bacterium]MBT8247621.1 ferritin [Acidimicrobiia bacterium]NNF87155.1 ferritin [Acidimicrobiia bacterium]NNL69670.1 ferritin [Acidimicrobiia bacterium]